MAGRIFEIIAGMAENWLLYGTGMREGYGYGSNAEIWLCT